MDNKNLEKEIKSKLEKMGAEVMYFDERPANSILAKGIIRIKKSLYQNKIDQYYHRILEKVKNFQDILEKEKNQKNETTSKNHEAIFCT